MEAMNLIGHERSEKNCTTKTYAPVIAFAYNRADKIIQSLEAMEDNPECSSTDLIIYSDGAKSEAGRSAVDQTRVALHAYRKRTRFHSVEIIEAPKNKGLACSIIEGVTEVLSRYGKAIIVEDDLLVSRDFLRYMNGALDFYEADTSVGAISGYTYPIKGLKDVESDIYIMHKGDCWGWATWSNRWNQASWAEVDYSAYFKNHSLRRRLEQTENGWDLLMLLQAKGKISSWAIRWVLYLLQNDLHTVYPVHSLVTNQGFDGSGTHSNQSEDAHYFTELIVHPEPFRFENVLPNEVLEKQAATFPRHGGKAFVKYYLKRIYVRLFDVLRIMHLA